MKITIAVLIMTMILVGCGKNDKYDLSGMSTENVKSLWSETSLTTEIHSKAYRELDKRDYFDKELEEENRKAEEIFKKYSK